MIDGRSLLMVGSTNDARQRHGVVCVRVPAKLVASQFTERWK